MKNKETQRKEQEVKVHKKQVDKLIEELREKSDSESFDDEKERVLNVKKALEAQQLGEDVKNLKNEIKQKELEFAQNFERMKSNLKFSQDSNINLKNDYDLLQEKFDKHMKATNNLNQDLKEEIEEQNVKISKLQIFYDDQQEIMQGERDKMKKEISDAAAAKDE